MEGVGDSPGFPASNAHLYTPYISGASRGFWQSKKLQGNNLMVSLKREQNCAFLLGMSDHEREVNVVG